MLLLTDFLIVGVILLLTYWIFKANRYPKKYPPGPYGIPLFGYMPFVNPSVPHKSITSLSKKYGDVFSLKLGSRDVVYLNSYDAAKEAFNNPHFLGRPDFQTFKVSTSSFLNVDVKLWELHRRFTIRHLRDFGFGKSSLEVVIAKEAEKLVERFREKLGKPFQVSNTLNITIVNIIWHMTTGLNLDDRDPFYNMLMDYVEESQHVFSCAFLADFLTWGASVFPNRITKLDLLQKIKVIMDTCIQKLIDEHEETLDIQKPRDLMDAYLIKMKEEQENGVNDSSFTYEILRANTIGLFMAGSETTSTTIKAALLLLAQHQDVQTKLKEEIQAVTGGERRVSLSDKYNLPYLESFMMEVQRYATISPFGLPHFTLQNTTVGEFHIPKGTVVLANQWAIHFEEKYWKDPLAFNPSRFLNEDGSVNYKREGFMPFSLGKRQCLGEQLAKAELLLFLGYLLQDFTFSTPADAPPVSLLDATGGVIITPPPFEMIASYC